MLRFMQFRFQRLWREKIRPWWNDYEWPVVGALALVLVFLGYIGFRAQSCSANKPSYFLDMLFQSCQLFVMQISVESPMPWPLNVARLLAPLVAGYTALKALGELFGDQLRSLRRRYCHNHIVICGLGHKGYLIAQEFLANGKPVVIVERSAENDGLRQCQEEGAFVILGDAAEPEVIAKARIEHSLVVIAVCGDDGVNAQVALTVRECVSAKRKQPLQALIHIGDPTLYQRIVHHEPAIRARAGSQLEYFNIFHRGAVSLLNEFPLFNPAVGPGQTPHLIVVGGGLMGEQLVVETARGWLPRFMMRNEILPVTLVDPAATDKCELWRVKHACLATGCVITPLDLAIDSAEFHRAKFLPQATIVIVCLEDDRSCIATALALHRRLEGRPTQVVACVTEVEGLPLLLLSDTVQPGWAGQLHFFGLLNRTWSLDLLIGGPREQIARLLHEDYVASQKAAGQTTTDNMALASWDELATEFRDSNLLESDFIWVKLQAVGCGLEPLTNTHAEKFQFTDAEIERMARMEHARWRSERLLKGWNYGPKRDDKLKSNPNLVPWDDLTDDLRNYNRKTIHDLPTLLARAALQVHRLTG